MILLPDDMEDAILLWEAWRDKVIDVCKLSHKVVGVIKDFNGALVGVLAGGCQL